MSEIIRFHKDVINFHQEQLEILYKKERELLVKEMQSPKVMLKPSVSEIEKQNKKTESKKPLMVEPQELQLTELEVLENEMFSDNDRIFQRMQSARVNNSLMPTYQTNSIISEDVECSDDLLQVNQLQFNNHPFYKNSSCITNNEKEHENKQKKAKDRDAKLKEIYNNAIRNMEKKAESDPSILLDFNSHVNNEADRLLRCL